MTLFLWIGKSVLFSCWAGANVDAFAATQSLVLMSWRETAKLHFKNMEKALALARLSRLEAKNSNLFNSQVAGAFVFIVFFRVHFIKKFVI